MGLIVSRNHQLARRAMMAVLLVAALSHASDPSLANEAAAAKAVPMVGMYVHQHWAYNHPYAARTWSLDDWQGYLGGLKSIGYNAVLIWPVLETMPNPLTPSDAGNLEKIRQVIDFAHDELDMRAFVVLCPNVVSKDVEAAKYEFVDRPFFYTDRRIDPADAVEMGKMIQWREGLLRPLKNMDGLVIIDSDPGGYPNSKNIEFVYLLSAHRNLLDKLRPEMDLYYWIAHGWEAYGRFYATAQFGIDGTPGELDHAIRQFAELDAEPWGLFSWRGLQSMEATTMSERVVSFQYGGIEGEPTFPMTNFATPAAERTGREMCGQGTFGNAQTHCVQLPNTFLFARGAQRLTTTRDDYVQFAEKLIPGLGETIVAGWEALNTPDSATKWDAITKLDALAERNDIAAGELAGLLFNDPQRFVADLAKMLRLNATFIDFRDAAASGQSGKALAAKMAPFVEAVAVWQGTHNYKNNWTWPELQNVLMQIDADAYAPVYALLQYKGMGATPFEQVQDGYRKVELFTPTLIETMKSTVKKLSS